MLKKTAWFVFAFLLSAFYSAARAQVYTGHDSIPALRGVNVGSSTLSSDLPMLTTLGINVVRYEIAYDKNYSGYSSTAASDFNGGSGDVTTADITSYHNWLNWEVTNSASDLNTCITYCAAHGIKVLIDMHLSPGGSVDGGVNRIFLYSDCRTEFVNDWGLIAQTYASSTAVWGYDLLNEPNDSSNSVGNWNSAALAAAQKVRQYDSAGGTDPSHAIIEEIASAGFPGLTPLTGVSGVVYSFHTYGDYTWYSGQDNDSVGTRVWPDATPDDSTQDPATTPYKDSYNFTRHDLTYLYQKDISAARAFQLANNCKIFVGEFGAFRWSPGSAEYVSEMINYFESFGWDWTLIGFRSDTTGQGAVGTPNAVGGWNGFDPEIGPYFDINTQGPGSLPFAPKTDVKTALTSWFTNNAAPSDAYDFFTPSVGTGPNAINYNTAGSAWTFTNTSGCAGNGSNFNNPNSMAGTQCAFLQSNNTSTQGILSRSLQWQPGCKYSISFSSAQRISYPPQTISVYLGGTISSGVLSGGTLVGTITPSGTAWAIYSTAPFVAATGTSPVSSLLSFVGASTTNDQTAFLDNVTVSHWLSGGTQPVSDYNFLSPALGSGVIAPSVDASPWDFAIWSGIASNGSGFNNPDTIGKQCAYLQSANGAVGLMCQPIQLMPNASYTVNFNAAQRPSYPAQTIKVYIGGTVSGTTLSGGTLVGTITPSSTAWARYSTGAFSSGQGSLPVTQLLSFVGSPAASDQTAFLDSVAVTKTPPSFLPLGLCWLTAASYLSDAGTSALPSGAYDGNTSTYYSSTGSPAWTGIDLGAGKQATVTHVYFYPQTDGTDTNPDYATSMDGGQFQWSDNGASWTTFNATVTVTATINSNDDQYGQHWGARRNTWCQFPIFNAAPHRYFRYLGPSGKSGNIAEVRFYGAPSAGSSTGYISNGAVATVGSTAQKAFDGNYQTIFDKTQAGNGWTGIDLGAGNTAAVNQVSFYAVRTGTTTLADMTGGVFQGSNVLSNTDSNWTNLVPTIASANTSPIGPEPGAFWQTITLPTPAPGTSSTVYPTPYRYLRYKNSSTGTSSVSEIQFYGNMSHVLTGTNVNDAWGTTWGNPPTNAFDGSTSTVYESNLPTGGWTGIDVGAANPAVVTSVCFYPDSSWSGGPSQMVGGVFQGSKDGTSWTNLTAQIATAPTISVWTTLPVIAANAGAYRYLRYYDNAGSNHYCDVAEVKFLGY